MKYKIKVTKKDIKKGEPGNCDSCAISYALRKKFNTMDVRTVVDRFGNVNLYVDDKLYQVSDMHQNHVLGFIEDFDNMADLISLKLEVGELKPFEFEMMEKPC